MRSINDGEANDFVKFVNNSCNPFLNRRSAKLIVNSQFLQSVALKPLY